MMMNHIRDSVVADNHKECIQLLQHHQNNNNMKYYVSVTGLQVKSVWHLPLFFRYAIKSITQAQAAAGNIDTRTGYRNGVRHTLTIWEDKISMLRFMRAGAHAEAMKATNELSVPESTKVYGYESDTIPTWDEALALWEVHGMRHGKVFKAPTSTTTTISNGKSLPGTTKVIALLTIITIVSVLVRVDYATLILQPTKQFAASLMKA